jgi:hypothetical protein
MKYNPALPASPVPFFGISRFPGFRSCQRDSERAEPYSGTGGHHRRSIRLKAYDYAQEGGYYVDICTHDRECLFGEVVNEQMRLNDIGKIVQEEWLRT